MKTKGIYVVSNIDKALAFEWIASEINKNKFELKFILLNPGSSVLANFLQNVKIPVYALKYNGKKDLPATLFKIYKILKKEKPAFIHTHLFDASLIGLTAGKLAGVRKRIITRHHGNQHHVYFPRAVRYDKWISALATAIVAPSASVKDILVNLEQVNPDKVKIIHHGFNLSYFKGENQALVSRLKEKYNPNNQWPVLGVISRYTELKGLQFVIPAFKKILKLYPDALLILANATGDYKAQVQEILKEIDNRNYTEITFEPNVAALYRLFQVFVHVPITASSEAFGQTYVEALAAGIPSVFTLSGVAKEFIRHEENAYVVPFRDADAIYAGMLELIQNKELADHLTSQGRQDVDEQFNLRVMIGALEDLYEQ